MIVKEELKTLVKEGRIKELQELPFVKDNCNSDRKN